MSIPTAGRSAESGTDRLQSPDAGLVTALRTTGIAADTNGFDTVFPTAYPARLLRQTGASSGPGVGEQLPDFALADQWGRRVDFHVDRAGHPAALVFCRSVVWDPASLTQLLELRDALHGLADAGLKVYAVTYDDPGALWDFSISNRIRFSILSDVESAVIRAFSLDDGRIRPGDGIFHGMAHPGAYVTDADGRVVAKWIRDNPMERPDPAWMIDAARGRLTLHPEDPVSTPSEADGVRLIVALRGRVLKPTVARRVVVRIEVASGVTLDCDPACMDTSRLRVELDGPDELRVGDAIYAPGDPVDDTRTNGASAPWRHVLDVQVPVYVGSTPVASRNSGQLAINVTVRYRVRSVGEDGMATREPAPRSVVLAVPFVPMDVPALRAYVPALRAYVPALRACRGYRRAQSSFAAAAHLRRLWWRKVRAHPFGYARYLLRSGWYRLVGR